MAAPPPAYPSGLGAAQFERCIIVSYNIEAKRERH